MYTYVCFYVSIPTSSDTVFTRVTSFANGCSEPREEHSCLHQKTFRATRDNVSRVYAEHDGVTQFFGRGNQVYKV